MNRPISVTVVAVAALSGAIILALISFAFLLVGGMVLTGAERGDPVSVAISRNGRSGWFFVVNFGERHRMSRDRPMGVARVAKRRVLRVRFRRC